ncbi:MAG: B12-binding domain-containing protein, partial [Candidatus Bathyarchaeota archaeon]|nr:B12-binding domain-containing protein [Candidatus Bathyarchaeota archaeon]
MSMKEKEALFNELREALVGFDVEAAKRAALEAMEEGVAAERVVEVMSEAMEIVGDRYQAGEYFVTELIIAGEVMKEVL